MRENRQDSEEIVETVLSADDGDDEEDDAADKEGEGEQHTNDREEDEKGEPISTAPAL